jgi:hypothetical protein
LAFKIIDVKDIEQEGDIILCGIPFEKLRYSFVLERFASEICSKCKLKTLNRCIFNKRSRDICVDIRLEKRSAVKTSCSFSELTQL